LKETRAKLKQIMSEYERLKEVETNFEIKVKELASQFETRKESMEK